MPSIDQLLSFIIIILCATSAGLFGFAISNEQWTQFQYTITPVIGIVGSVTASQASVANVGPFKNCTTATVTSTNIVGDQTPVTTSSCITLADGDLTNMKNLCQQTQATTNIPCTKVYNEQMTVRAILPASAGIAGVTLFLTLFRVMIYPNSKISHFRPLLLTVTTVLVIVGLATSVATIGVWIDLSNSLAVNGTTMTRSLAFFLVCGGAGCMFLATLFTLYQRCCQRSVKGARFRANVNDFDDPTRPTQAVSVSAAYANNNLAAIQLR